MLQLVPRCLTLGVGCRKGVSCHQIYEAFLLFCRMRRILPQAVCSIASIDRKCQEAGLLEFCRDLEIQPVFFSVEELNSVQGTFTTSEFVLRTTGTDNVCERSAVFASGGILIEKKFAMGGVSFALAAVRQRLDWNI